MWYSDVRQRGTGKSISVGVVLALILGVGVGGAITLAASSNKSPVTNPDRGLADAQRALRYSQLRGAFEAHYTSWLEHLDIGRLALGKLPRESMLGTGVAAQAQTLAEAVAGAEYIVVGTATAIKPTPFSGTAVTLAVTATVKGPSVKEVTIVQPGGLLPTSDWKGVIVASAPTDPLLLPGQEALLFLTRAAGSTNFSVQPVTGLYSITRGTVEAVLGNPFAPEVSGRSVAAMKGQIAAVPIK